MKQKTLAIGALLLAMNCFSQTDTLQYSVSGKCKFEFDYNHEYSDNSSENQYLKSLVKLENYEDFKFKLKKDEFLFLDLVDGLRPDTLYLTYRDVTVYYRDGEVRKLYFNSKDNTLRINGVGVRKLIVHKPELK